MVKSSRYTEPHVYADGHGGPCTTRERSTVPDGGPAAGPARTTGITPDTIALIVDEFYAECRRDPVLGPVFERHVDNWDEHLARIRAFWSSAMLKSGKYSGRPLESHLAIPGLVPDHFTLWLRLFSQTVSKHCSPQDAAAFMALAGRMARVIVANSNVRKSRVVE